MGICLHIGHRSCIVSSLTAPLSSRETETAPSKNQVVVCDFSASWRGGVIVAEFHLWKGTSHDPLTEMVDGRTGHRNPSCPDESCPGLGSQGQDQENLGRPERIDRHGPRRKGPGIYHGR